MAMQFRNPFEIMLPWHMKHGAAEVFPWIMLYLRNDQKQGRSRLCARSFTVMHQPNGKQDCQKMRLGLKKCWGQIWKHILLCQSPLLLIISYCQFLSTFFAGKQTYMCVELRMSSKKDFKKYSHSLQISQIQKSVCIWKGSTVTWQLFDTLEFEDCRFLKSHCINVLFRNQCHP